MSFYFVRSFFRRSLFRNLFFYVLPYFSIHWSCLSCYCSFSLTYLALLVYLSVRLFILCFCSKICLFVILFCFFSSFFIFSSSSFLSFLLPSFLPLILGDDSNRSQSINQSIRLSTVFLPFSLWFCPCLYIINFFPTYLSTYFRNCPLWTNFEQVTWATRFWSQKRVSSSLFTNSKNWFKKETNTQNQEENC